MCQNLSLVCDARRIYRGAGMIFTVSKCKNWFCQILKCVSIIFILNIYASDSTLTEGFRRAVSKLIHVDSSSIHFSWCDGFFGRRISVNHTRITIGNIQCGPKASSWLPSVCDPAVRNDNFIADYRK